MTCRQYLYPSVFDRARVLCEEQLLFVLGRKLFGKIRYIMRMCLCALIWLSVHDSLSTPDESVLTRNYATQWNKRKRSKRWRSSFDHLHCWSVVIFVCFRTKDDLLQCRAYSYTEFTGETARTPEPSLSTLCLFAVFISQWQCVFICMVPVGLHDPNALAHPVATSPPPFSCIREHNIREQSSSPSSGLIMSLHRESSTAKQRLQGSCLSELGFNLYF